VVRANASAVAVANLREMQVRLLPGIICTWLRCSELIGGSPSFPGHQSADSSTCAATGTSFPVRTRS
jgi:hypothetical protein